MNSRKTGVYIHIPFCLKKCAYCDFVSYENVPCELKEEYVSAVISELPELCIKYDPSHAYNRGDNYLDEISDWAHRFAHVHIKGTTIAGKNPVDDPPAGMDDLRWGSIFSILYARGYDGDLSIEPHSATWRGELGDAGVAFTRDYIRQFILR